MTDAPKATAPTVNTITSAEYQQCWSEGPLSHLQLLVTDTTYCVQDEAGWLADFKATNSRFARYVPETRDCDNYAVFLAGAISMQHDVNGVAIVFDTSGKHCYNAVVVSENGKMAFRLVEPQSDKFVTADAAGKAPYAEKAGFAVAT